MYSRISQYIVKFEANVELAFIICGVFFGPLAHCLLK